MLASEEEEISAWCSICRRESWVLAKRGIGMRAGGIVPFSEVGLGRFS